jgi:[ribosomal protein S5]-alanine N-acetyltransferase
VTATTIQLKSVRIRSWSKADASSLQRHANNRKIWLNLRDLFPHPYEMHHAEWFLKHVAEENPEMTLAIATEAEAIGCIGLRRGVDVHRKTAEMGYWLSEAYWGRGIMSEAVEEFTRWCFRTFDLVRIYAEPFETNSASIRVLEKAGFTLEGRMRKSVCKNGQVMDSFLYALVRS